MCKPGTRLMEGSHKTRLMHPGPKLCSHSTPGWICPGKGGLDSVLNQKQIQKVNICTCSELPTTKASRLKDVLATGRR